MRGPGLFSVKPGGAQGDFKCGGQTSQILSRYGSHLLCPPGDRPLSKDKTSIQGATGKTKSYPWTQGGITDRGKGMITHSFLVMPDCPYPLLDRDLLQKLHATISFHGDAATLTVGDRPVTILFSCPLSEKYILFEAPGPLNLAPFSKNYSRPFPMCGLKPIHLGWPLTSP